MNDAKPETAQRPLKRGDTVTVTIEQLTQDGRGVSRVAGKVLFVSDALPGEVVDATVVKRRRSHDEAGLGQVLTASALRVEPQCEWFGNCGGCSLQHLAPQAQLEMKQQWLVDALCRIGKVEPDTLLEPLAGPVWGYRRRARLAVKFVDGKGRVLVGFRERHKPFVTDMQGCEVLEPRAAILIAPLQELIATLTINKRLPQIEVAVGCDSVVLVMRVLDEPTDDDLARLKAFAASHDVTIALQRGGPDTVAALDGSTPVLRYELPDYDLQLQFLATDFVQINEQINRSMIAAVLGQLAIRPDDRVLDLFCGLGNFTLPIARSAAKVVGVEGSAALIARAQANARLNHLDNTEFVVADLAKAPEKLPSLQQSYDLILLDPPRSGAAEICELAATLDARRIGYVSCHPATLARDAQILIQQGYRLSSAGVMDMFPHTAHVESMAVFERVS